MRTEYPIKLDYGIYDHCFPHISDTNGIAFGKTKAFVTKNTYFEILQISAAIVLQSIFRQKIVEVHRKKQINAIYRIQYNFLTYLAKRLLKKHMKAIRIIQRIYKLHYSNRFVSIKDNYEELSKSTQTEYDIDTLQQQIQEQEILLIRAKRLIQLYDTHFYDPYLRTRSRNFYKLGERIIARESIYTVCIWNITSNPNFLSICHWEILECKFLSTSNLPYERNF